MFKIYNYSKMQALSEAATTRQEAYDVTKDRDLEVSKEEWRYDNHIIIGGYFLINIVQVQGQEKDKFENRNPLFRAGQSNRVWGELYKVSTSSLKGQQFSDLYFSFFSYRCSTLRTLSFK